MHDPHTLAFSIKNPLSRKRFKPDIISIWHVDPCRGPGGDDSCGWFKRAHHGDQSVMDRAIKRLESDWDRVWTYDPAEDGGAETGEAKQSYPSGMFFPNGMPRYSASGIMVNVFFSVALEHFRKGDIPDWKKAKQFMQRNIFEIMHFAENPVDSMFDSIVLKYGNDEKREERIRGFVATAYGYLLRLEQKWWQHPRWHFWHWKIQVHPIEQFKRWVFSRCCKCGGRFKYGESPTTNDWNGKGPRWFRSEPNIYHSSHCGADRSPCETQAEVAP